MTGVDESPPAVSADVWESTVLGLRVGRFTRRGPAPAPPAVPAEFDVVYCAAPRPVLWSSPPPGWHAVGTLVTLGREVPPSFDEPADVRPADDVDGLAERVGFGGRYERDPRLRDSGTRVYGRWLRDAAADSRRDVLIAGGGAGVVVLRRGDPARVELVGVASDRRGEGVGRRLVGAAISAASHAGATRIDVGAYGDNLPALGLYRAAGFVPVSTEWRYHWWLTAANP